MYGKKRITISKNDIVLAGNKSWLPIGKFVISNGLFRGKLLKSNFHFERYLNENNSIDFEFKTLNEIRKFAKKEYESRLNEM